jgi:hypothetical protein
MKNIFALLCITLGLSTLQAQDYWKRTPIQANQIVAVGGQIWATGYGTLYLLNDEGDVVEDLYEKWGFNFTRVKDISGNAGTVALATDSGTYLFSGTSSYDFFPEVFESVHVAIDRKLYTGNKNGLFERVDDEFRLISAQHEVYEIEKLDEEIFVNSSPKKSYGLEGTLHIFKDNKYDTVNIESISPELELSGVRGGGVYKISATGTFLRIGRDFVLEKTPNNDWELYHYEESEGFCFADISQNEKLIALGEDFFAQIKNGDTTIFSGKDGVLTHGKNQISDLMIMGDRYVVLDREYIYVANSDVQPLLNEDHVVIDANSLKGTLDYNGNLFRNKKEFKPGLTTSDSLGFAFGSNLWAAAKTSTGDLRTSYETFNNGDNVYGPWYGGVYQDELRPKQSTLVKVTKAEIEYHLANFNDPTYVTPLGIKNWPGNGDVANGESELLAPYVDTDGNGVYSPSTGDYPAIIGDQMAYVIINDAQNTFNNYQAIGLEVHISVFAWDSNEPYLANTIFTNYRIINRSGENFPEFKVGFWQDMDLGNSDDDFVGCDSINNVFYCYNGRDDDIGGFGLNPPAYGTKVLCSSLDGFMSWNIRDYVYENPIPDAVHLLLNNQHPDTSMHTFEGVPTKFMFAGDPMSNTGDTEINSNNSPYDRRGLGTFPKTSLMAGETISYTLAHSYARKESPDNHLENIGELISQLNKAEDHLSNLRGSVPFEWPNSYACNLVGVDNNIKNIDVVNMYPNPTNGSVSLRSSTIMQNVEVYSITGSLVHQQSISSSKTAEVKLDKTLPNGIYLLEIKLQNGEKTRKKLNLMR